MADGSAQVSDSEVKCQQYQFRGSSCRSHTVGDAICTSGFVGIGVPDALLFSLIVSVGLIAQIFYSSRYGYDEPPNILSDDDDLTSG